MAEERNPFPQPNAIRQYTQAELVRRKVNSGDSKLAVPNPLSMPFVRFTSTKVDAGPPKAYRFFHMGLHGLPLTETSEGIGEFGNIFEMSYGQEDVVGYAFGTDGRRTPITSTDIRLPFDRSRPIFIIKDQTPAEGRHPVPGVTDVSVRHMGVNEPIQTTVSWVCYNKAQLEFLRQHFLMAGGYVVLEFGNLWSNRDEPTPVFDFSNHDEALDKLTKFVINGRKFMSDELFERANGNYNMVIGRVVDQSITFESDGTIHCTTIFYSTGEAVFGIHNTRLLSGLSTEKGREKFSLTINEFFSDNGVLDRILSRSEFVVEVKARSEREIRSIQGGEELTDAQKEAFRSRYSSSFIPWSVFIREILGILFSQVSAAEVSADAKLFKEINLQEPEVGNHPQLASTDPDTLIIVKSFMLQGSQAPSTSPSNRRSHSRRVDPTALFTNHPPENELTFVSADNTEEKGLLTNGIWVNVGAIKESFSQANTFYQGFMALLTRMNNAVENYWDLDLAFDEEEQEYKIYDKKCVFGTKSIPEPYVFNRATAGELVELGFEANFSKESKTAILLSNPAKTRGEAIGKTTDGFNQPSIWTEVMNLPELKDELGENVQKTREAAFQSSRPDETEEGFTLDLTVLNRSVAGFLENIADAEAQAEAESERISRIARFGNGLEAYIAGSTKLILDLSNSGQRSPEKINNFVAPIPTEINLSLTTQGINGFAFYDTFLVDKLPRIYEDHGVFLINEIQHGVTLSGWLTTIGGLYYFVNVSGERKPSDQPVASNQEIPRPGVAVEGTTPTISKQEEDILRNNPRVTRARRIVSGRGRPDPIRPSRRR